MNMMEDLDYLMMEVSFKLINIGLTVATPPVVEMSISDADFPKLSDLSGFIFSYLCVFLLLLRSVFISNTV